MVRFLKVVSLSLFVLSVSSMGFGNEGESFSPEMHKDEACAENQARKEYKFLPAPETEHEQCEFNYRRAIEICQPRAGFTSSQEALNFKRKFCPLHISAKTFREQSIKSQIPVVKLEADFIPINREVHELTKDLSHQQKLEYTKKISSAYASRDRFHASACSQVVDSCSRSCSKIEGDLFREFEKNCSSLLLQAQQMGNQATEMRRVASGGKKSQKDSRDQSVPASSGNGIATLAGLGVGAVAVGMVMQKQQSGKKAAPQVASVSQPESHSKRKEKSSIKIADIRSQIATYKEDNMLDEIEVSVHELMERGALQAAQEEIASLENSERYSLANLGRKLRAELEEKHPEVEVLDTAAMNSN